MPKRLTNLLLLLVARCKRAGDQNALIRQKVGGPRLASEAPATANRSLALLGEASSGSKTTTGVGDGGRTASAARMRSSADSNRDASQPRVSAAIAATGSWPSVPQSSNPVAESTLEPAKKA